METLHLCLFMMLCVGVHSSSSKTLQRQKRNWIIDSFKIDEGYEGAFPYSLGRIHIEKSFTLFKIHGQGVDEEPIGVLKINEDTGEITVHSPVDYEKTPIFKLRFQAFDKGNHILDTELGIEIEILDANDNPPKFEAAMYEVSIAEATAQGTAIITLMGSDHDHDKNNRLFDLKIVSVTPEPQDLEFTLSQISETQTGTISFKGCLDHEKAEKYTIIVEAKDRGEKVQLSSSCTVVINIVDGNNHLPAITGQTGPGNVKEGEENVLVSRLQVTDGDTRGTPAWRAKYLIQGDPNNNFRITTDPDTNQGLLYVEKHLDFEDGRLKNLTITVENEIPYQSCKVVRRTQGALWEVVTVSGSTAGGVTGTETRGRSTQTVTVTVEDVNEPPVFDKPIKTVSLSENTEAGQYLETFTARDPDVMSANTFVYSKGEDPADWISVDPKTGKITTTKALDRESPFVKDNIYKITVFAVDDGKPPMTGTATLSIYISDANDNTPTLASDKIDMCQTDGASVANITVLDLDEDPYGGPFRFRLLGDVEGKWSVDPLQGFSVNLVKDNRVHSGHFTLMLEVSDLQHKTAVHNLSVTVCTCSNTARPNCSRTAAGPVAGGGVVGIIVFSLLLLAGMALLLLSCETNHNVFTAIDGGSGHLMNCNTETPGTDCQVVLEAKNQSYQKVKQIQTVSQVPTMTALKQSTIKTTAAAVSHARSEHTLSQMEKQQGTSLHMLIDDSINESSRDQYRRKSFREQEFTCGNLMQWKENRRKSFGEQDFTRGNSMQWKENRGKSFGEQEFTRGNSMRWSTMTSSAMRTGHQERNSMRGLFSRDTSQSWMRKHAADDEIGFHREILFKVLNTMLYNVKAADEELGDDALHVYAEEDDRESRLELDAISIPEVSFDPDFNQSEISRFSTLASICMPHESSDYSTRTSHVMETHGTETLIRTENHKTDINTRSCFLQNV